MKKYLIYLFISIIPFPLYSQSRDLFNLSMDAMEDPSVEAWEMMRFGGDQHALNTGTMTFSLPLYTYRDEDFEIPMSLEYSFDGYRPSVHSGTVGLGWYLECGGVITRDVKGMADETNWGDGWDHGYYYTVTHESGQQVLVTNKYFDRFGICSRFTDANIELNTDIPQYWFRGEGFRSRYDVNPDIFHFRFLGHHGDFIMLEDGTFQVFNSDLPYGTVQVQMETRSGLENVFSAFTLDTGDGYTYRFEPGGWSKSSQIQPSQDCFQEGDTVEEFLHNVGHISTGIYSKLMQGILRDDAWYPNGVDLLDKRQTVTLWQLTQITAPNGNTVEFSYKKNFGLDIGVSIYYSPAYLYAQDTQASPPPLPGEVHDFQTSQSAEIRTLSSSNSSPLEAVRVNGKEIIRLMYSKKERMESTETSFCKLPVSHIYEDDLPLGTALNNELALNTIIVNNRVGAALGAICLEQFYTGASGGAPRMMLQSVNNSMTGVFGFEYNVDSTFVFPHNDTEATDYWGFWNGKSYTNFRQYLCSNGMNAVSLYDQVSSGIKNPDYTYSAKGALTRIVYPTGGYTEISYEPHSVGQLLYRDEASFPYTIANTRQFEAGGVRVKRIRENAGGSIYTRRYTYLTGQGGSSGILMQMPRYLIPTEVHLSAETLNLTNDLAIFLLLYTSDTVGTMSSDPHVTYSAVQECYEDHSIREYLFTDYDDYPDGYTEGTHYAKILPHELLFVSFYSDSQAEVLERLCAPPTIDNHMMRGKVKQITTTVHSPEGRRVTKTEKTFYNKTTHSSADLYYNMIACFSKIPYIIQSPFVIRTEEEEMDSGDPSCSTLVRNCREYNGKGQLVSETQMDRSGNGRGIYYKYAHETNSGGLLSSISDIAETALADSVEYFLRRNRMLYEGLNPNPIRVTQFSASSVTPAPNDVFSSQGNSRIFTMTYNNKYRPTQISSVHSGYMKYIWDDAGDYLVSREENALENVTSFEWKDMVGLARITLPTGQETRYEYDSRNRLLLEYNQHNQAVKRYDYHVDNE